ncbi:MAG: hypothetical protein ONB55_22435 [candidate division KSB1 bacterium]|nr:hypothetical protein [candidate division KSB1 bacterium]
MLPAFEQARKAIWTAVNPHSGKRRIDEAFPVELRRRVLEDEMFIEFANGSTWQLAGSDSYNRLVGASYAGIVYSEYALANPAAQGYFTPMLIENGGWELMITTPRGKNHAEAMYRHGKRMMEGGGDWYAEVSPASVTKALSEEMLASELERLQALHGEEYGRALWEQEYECSFEVAVPGSVFGDAVRRLEREGRLGEVGVLEGVPVMTGWDLGRTDDTAIWWVQVWGGEVRWLDCHVSSGKDVGYYAEVLERKREERGWEYGVHFLPHDARPRTLASPRSIWQQFEELNRGRYGGRLGEFRIAPRLDKVEQWQALRATLAVSWMDEGRCAEGLEALRHYHREWDDEGKRFVERAVHDWSSHAVDGALTLAVAWRHGRVPEGGGRGYSVVGGEKGRVVDAVMTFGEWKKRHLERARRRREGAW